MCRARLQLNSLTLAVLKANRDGTARPLRQRGTLCCQKLKGEKQGHGHRCGVWLKINPPKLCLWGWNILSRKKCERYLLYGYFDIDASAGKVILTDIFGTNRPTYTFKESVNIIYTIKFITSCGSALKVLCVFCPPHANVDPAHFLPPDWLVVAVVHRDASYLHKAI